MQGNTKRLDDTVDEELPPLDRRPASMKGFNVVHKYQKRRLLIAINCIAGLSICRWLLG